MSDWWLVLLAFLAVLAFWFLMGFFRAAIRDLRQKK